MSLKYVLIIIIMLSISNKVYAWNAVASTYSKSRLHAISFYRYGETRQNAQMAAMNACLDKSSPDERASCKVEFESDKLCIAGYLNFTRRNALMYAAGESLLDAQNDAETLCVGFDPNLRGRVCSPAGFSCNDGFFDYLNWGW